VDYAALRRLIERQIRAGVDGVVPVGTTGESPTLDYDDHRKVIEVTVQACRERVRVIAGTGANSTREAVELTRFAAEAGADATLQVAPYYNKPNQEGLARHFLEIADIGLPVVLYNIPGRTGVEIAADTVARLARHPRIVALKEAGGNVARVSQVLSLCDICVLSGDDPLTLPMMSIGAEGVISVASNVAPKAVADLVHAALDGNWARASALHRKYYPLFAGVFLDTNPIPVKAALAMLNMASEELRLPMTVLEEAKKAQLRQLLKDYGLLD